MLNQPCLSKALYDLSSEINDDRPTEFFMTQKKEDNIAIKNASNFYTHNSTSIIFSRHTDIIYTYALSSISSHDYPGF